MQSVLLLGVVGIGETSPAILRPFRMDCGVSLTWDIAGDLEGLLRSSSGQFTSFDAE